MFPLKKFTISILFLEKQAELSGSGVEPLSDINLTTHLGVSGISVTEGGRGYFNIDPANQPSAIVDASGVVSPEENASLK